MVSSASPGLQAQASIQVYLRVFFRPLRVQPFLLRKRDKGGNGDGDEDGDGDGDVDKDRDRDGNATKDPLSPTTYTLLDTPFTGDRETTRVLHFGWLTQ